MKKICVTGANGFIGKALCEALILSGNSVRGFVRHLNQNVNSGSIEHISVGDISSNIIWKDQLHGYDCIVHCAGKAHVMNKKNELEVYHLVNTEHKRLAEQAVEAV